MYQAVELKHSPEVKAIIRAGFPEYRKHKAYLDVYPESGMRINSYWSGGTHDEFAVVDLATGKAKNLPTQTHPFFDVAAHGIEGQSQDVDVDRVGNVRLRHLPEGFALVRAGYFCGKPATAHVYVNPSNLVKLLGE